MNATLGAANDAWRSDQVTRATQRRRAMEEDRRRRIFDAKTRVFGVDTEALEAQIHDKQTQEQLEKERDEAFSDRMITAEHRVQLLDREAQRARKEQLQNQEEYRRTFQTKPTRREWDLSDPDSLKKETPARVADDDPRTGPSSMQRFGGEDLRFGPRVRKQQSQMATWVKQQMAEKELQMQNERELERMEEERMAELNERRAQIEEHEIASRRRMNHAVKDYNQALAEARRERERIEQLEDIACKIEEVHNNIHSDLLSENPLTAASATHSHRVRPDHFKGMSQDQVATIRDMQASQIAERAMIQQRQREEEEQWQLAQEAVRRNLIAGEREVSRRRQELARQLQEDQRRQAREQRANIEYLDKVVYTNKPTNAYYEQFGTTTR